MNLSGRGLILVLGMHRSGTSVTAKMVQSIGAYMGDKLMPPGAANPTGFFEDVDVVALNDSILHHFNLVWSDLESPSAHNLITAVPEQLHHRANVILARLFDSEANPVIAIKDPRMSRLLSFWQTVILPTNVRVKCVISIRHPAAIAASLWTRDKLTINQSLDLWSRHMLECSAQMFPAWPRLIVDYDRVLTSPAYEFLRVADFLGASPPAHSELSFASFIDKNLRHAVLPSANVSLGPPYQGLWESLYSQANQIPGAAGTIGEFNA